jgi:hypothetical protein
MIELMLLRLMMLLRRMPLLLLYPLLGQPATRLRTTVALYTPPGPLWQRLAHSAKAFPALEVVAIISPRHSDNDSPFAGDDIERYIAHNRTWLDGLKMLREAGVKLEHYLHLRNLTCPRRGQCPQPGKTTRSYCLLPSGGCVKKNRCCNSLENASGIINASLTYFPEDGLFLDNGPFSRAEPDSPMDTLQKVRDFEKAVFDLTQRGAGPGGRRVTSNGVMFGGPDHTTRSRFDGLDPWAPRNLNETFMFEDGAPELVANVTPGYPRSRFSVLVRGVASAAQMRRVIDRFLAAGYGDICVMGVMTGADLYQVLPAYWEQEVEYLARKSSAGMWPSTTVAAASPSPPPPPPASIFDMAGVSAVSGSLRHVNGSGTDSLVLDASCALVGNCSAQLQSLLNTCIGDTCDISFSPPGAQFPMEQSGALNATGVRGLALHGRGALLLLRGDVALITVVGAAGLSLSNFTVAAMRPAFTYGVVIAPVAAGMVTVSVDVIRYPFHVERWPWTLQVDAMHEVDTATLNPTANGLDWIFSKGRPETKLRLQVNQARSTVSFVDRGFDFRLGAGIVLRHMLEFTHRQLDSIVLRQCTDVAISDVTIHSAPGMGVLAFDCTNLRLERVKNIPESTSLPLAGNADALHFASCRGSLVVTDCVANRQGDDALNVHSQYGIVESVDTTLGEGLYARHSSRISIAPHPNGDNTSWVDLFARPVFRVNDTVVIRRVTAGLRVSMRAVITGVEGSPTAQPLILSIDSTSAKADEIDVHRGDIIESVSAKPSIVVVAGCRFTNSRASGIILQSDNVTVSNNTIANTSSHAISSGGYYTTFSESPFGSGLSIHHNNIRHAALGHRVLGGGHWGGGGAITISGSRTSPNSTSLHRHISLQRNVIAPLLDQPAVSAEATTGLLLLENVFCAALPSINVFHCANVTSQSNLCCDANCTHCLRCSPELRGEEGEGAHWHRAPGKIIGAGKNKVKD